MNGSANPTLALLRLSIKAERINMALLELGEPADSARNMVVSLQNDIDNITEQIGTLR